jgi:hypothetical protein
MYNDCERCDDHIDLYATLGSFRSLFDCKLYGYYTPTQCSGVKEGYLEFTLFFAHPFDFKSGDGDPNGSCRQEVDGFKGRDDIELEIKRKNIKVVTLEYKDGSNYDEPGILERLFGRKSYLPQIRELKDNALLYKVTFSVPFDVIADYVTVDKILMRDDGSFGKQKNYHGKNRDKNSIETMFKNIHRIGSLMTEIGVTVNEIKNDPARYKRDNEEFDWAEECRTVGGLNIEHAEILLKKSKKAFEDMAYVLFNARAYDFKAEPEDDVKCAHDLCIRTAEKDSKYCNKCIQLSTKECNYCKKK